MQATAELQLIPIGVGISVRKEINSVVAILKAYDFIVETHASGTNIEGDLSDILSAVEKAHEIMHEQGVVRIVSYLKLETRSDKVPTLAGKKL
ncbi:MAG: MTH1187 family thiamine-binding protein [Gammaproteobacteria bacterium]|nr:MTH1187 family thiamine-binding protein [Gammaproteobacteria bacterium]